MKQFRYKTIFASKVRCLIDEEKDKILAKASLDNLKSIIPESVKNQPTLLAIAFNSCTPNLGNLNGAVIDTKTALAIYKDFIHLPINSEHSRTASYGHIVNASFSEFDINYATGSGSKILDVATIKDTNEPFNLSLAGVIYKLYAPELCEAIEESNDPNSSKYLDISASWELLYDEFDLAVGSKYLKDCEIISDEDKKEEYSKYLLHNNGSGKLPDGRPVFVLLKNEVIAGGIGLTFNPAGFVKGVVTDSEKSKISIKSSKSSTYICPECSESMEMDDDMDEDEEMECANCKKKSMGKKWKIKADISLKQFVSANGETDRNNETTLVGATKNDLDILGNKSVKMLGEVTRDLSKITESLKNLQKSEKSNSQSENNNVNKTKTINKANKIMLKTLANLKDEDLKEVTASEVVKAHKIDLDTEIQKISDEWEAKKGAVDKELKASNDKLAELEKQSKEVADKLAKATEDLEKLAKANADREQEEIFNTRMNYFDSEYDLEDEKIRNIVARKIKGADEAKYNEAKEEIELLLAAKKKSGKVFDKETKKWVDPKEIKEEKKETKASVENKEEIKTDVVDKAIDNGEKTKAAVAATTAPTITKSEEWAKAFGEDGWEIEKRAFRR